MALRLGLPCNTCSSSVATSNQVIVIVIISLHIGVIIKCVHVDVIIRPQGHLLWMYENALLQAGW